MNVIVGLGNIGDKYTFTRHNIGFIVVKILSEEFDISITDKHSTYLSGKGEIKEKEVLLAMPQNYMNRSGIAVRQILKKFNLHPQDIIIIHDDIDLDLGVVRIKNKGGDGGHRGIRSITECIQTKDFKRIRIGVGRPPCPQYAADYVLSRFKRTEEKTIKESIMMATQKICDLLK